MNQKKSVLIVEDERGMSNALKAKMEMKKFAVLIASDGDEGLKIALKEKPDLILLDILMPKMDGITMLKELRKDEWGKKVQVIVMTNAGKDSDKLADALESNVTEYLVKTDLSLERIADMVKEKLGR